jgi:hypothetical protein
MTPEGELEMLKALLAVDGAIPKNKRYVERLIAEGRLMPPDSSKLSVRELSKLLTPRTK